MINHYGYVNDFPKNDSYEKAIATFNGAHGYHLTRIKKKYEYSISSPLGTKKYKMLLREEKETRVISLILTPNYQYEIILRGAFNTLQNSLKKKHLIQNILTRGKAFTNNLILVAKRTLSLEDFYIIRSKLKLAEGTQDAEKWRKLNIYDTLSPFLNNMKLLGICEIIHHFDSNLEIGINNIIYAGLNFYYFSNKNMEDTINFYTQLLPQSQVTISKIILFRIS